jgi:hypothetical protein
VCIRGFQDLLKVRGDGLTFSQKKIHIIEQYNKINAKHHESAMYKV